MANPPVDSENRGFTPPRPIVVRTWERPVIVSALVVILVLGGIAGVRGLLNLFP